MQLLIKNPFIFREIFFFFLNLNICKIKGCKDKVAESEEMQGESPSTGLEFEALDEPEATRRTTERSCGVEDL